MSVRKRRIEVGRKGDSVGENEKRRGERGRESDKKGERGDSEEGRDAVREGRGEGVQKKLRADKRTK